MSALPTEDHASDLHNLDLGANTLLIQWTLGVSWDLE